MSLIKQILWTLFDRCECCGGELDIWDSKHSAYTGTQADLTVVYAPTP